MKKIIFCVSMIGIIIGIISTAYSVSPENKKNKKKAEQCQESSNPITWSLTVYIDDYDKDCPAQNCTTLYIKVYGADTYCHAVSSTELGSNLYDGSYYYTFNGSTNYTYLYITLYDSGGTCEFNSNTCCLATGTGLICHLNVCQD